MGWHRVRPPLVASEEDVGHQLRCAAVTRGALRTRTALTTALTIAAAANAAAALTAAVGLGGRVSFGRSVWGDDDDGIDRLDGG